jgi:ankyrin repeat protein
MQRLNLALQITTLVVAAILMTTGCSKQKPTTESQPVAPAVKPQPPADFDFAASGGYQSQKPEFNEMIGAVLKGDLPTVKTLIEKNPDLIFIKGNEGQTLLEMAAGRDDQDMAKLLLANHADINAQDDGGDTALSTAANSCLLNMAALLLASNADVNVKGGLGMNPLLWAAMNSQDDVLLLLLTHQADINIKDDLGRTPLAAATESDQKDAVKLLLDHHADVNSTNNAGMTPLHLAAWKLWDCYANTAATNKSPAKYCL